MKQINGDNAVYYYRANREAAFLFLKKEKEKEAGNGAKSIILSCV